MNAFRHTTGWWGSTLYSRSGVCLLVALITSSIACNGFQISAGGAQPQPAVPDTELPPDDFDKAADREPTTRTLYVLGKLYAGRGKLAEAEVAFKRVLLENPTLVACYVDLAEVQLRQHRSKDAMQTLRTGLKIAPMEPILLNDLGMCHVLQRQYEPALECFLSASGARPDVVRYRTNVAMTLGMMGRYEEAQALYSQVLSPADTHYNLGVISEARNDTDRAKMEFRLAETLAARQASAAPTLKPPATTRPARN